MSSSHKLTKRAEWIRKEAQNWGFQFIGFSRAHKLEKEAKQLETWLSANYHGRMGYMANHFEKRVDPRRLVPGAKTVISLMFNYANDVKQCDPSAPKISQYAYGQDYHHVLKRKLKSLLRSMQEEFGEINGRVFVDSAPVMERQWAEKSGLGWLGKNTLLIHPKAGSFYFLAEIICDLEIATDHPIRDHCGTCTKCIDACPTQAISPQGYLLDASKCISYLTIELKEGIPHLFAGKMDNWMFGCDVCQDVCPWNRFSEKNNEPAFEPQSELLEKTQVEWKEITEDVFQILFKKSAVKRSGYHGLKKNIKFLEQK